MLVDIPKDITAQKTEYKAKEIQPVERLTQKMTEEDIEQAVSYIRHAKKPYIFVGGGAVISGASEELKEFVELVDAPGYRYADGKRLPMTEQANDTRECLECMERRPPISESVSATC